MWCGGALFRIGIVVLAMLQVCVVHQSLASVELYYIYIPILH